MSEWKSIQLGDHAEVLSGFPFPSEGFSQEEGVPLIRIRDLLAGELETYFIGPYPDDFVIDDGDILIGMDGDFNIVRWAKGKALLNQRVCKVFTSTTELDDGYLFWLLEPELQDIHQKTPQTTVKHLSVRDLAQLRLEVPPVNEQRLVARILNTLDTQIQKTEALIAKLEKVKEGLLRDLLTRGIDENGQLRPSPEQAPVLYKESPLGLIPSEWEVEKTKQFSEIVTGSKDTQDKDKNGVYPFFVRSQKVERINSFSYDCTGVLTAGDGVGTGKVFHYIEGRFDLHQRVYLIFNFSDHVEPRFFFEWFRLKFIDRVSAFSAKNTVDSVRMEMIADMPCPAPPLNEQKAIVNCLFSLQERIDREKELLIKARTQKSGLMDDLLTGRVRVTPLLDQAQTTTPA